MSTQINTRQIKNNAALTNAGTPIDESLDTILSAIDSSLGTGGTYSNQDRNIKLVGTGIMSWISSNLVIATDSLYVQVPGLTKERNTILPQTITLSNDQVAYVDINRTAGVSANLTVSVANINALTPTSNIFIIARRINNNIIVDDTLLRDGDQDVILGESGKGGIQKWQTAKNYKVDNVIWEQTDHIIYTCLTDHTSDTFATDRDTNLYWQPMNGLVVEHEITINNHDDMNISNPIIDEVLVYDGTDWVNRSISSGGGGGGELVDLSYNAKLEDSFEFALDNTTPINISVGMTDATIRSVVNKYMRISYDASKTVSGTGTFMTISATPSFTIKAGDVIIVNSEARKIASITSQTIVAIDAAFSVDPTAAACCISQAVHTVDLNNFDNNGNTVSPKSQFPNDIYETLVSYQDSEALNDVVPALGVTPNISFSVSANGIDWSGTKIRPELLSQTEQTTSIPVANDELYVRFFANKTSGSGAVNLLSFKVFWHEDEGQLDGENYFTAFARPVDSIQHNCVHSVTASKSRFTFTETYPKGLNAGDPSGSALEVYVNGQLIPRYETMVDEAGAYFKEVTDQIIELDIDYSLAEVDFQFKVPRLVIDTNTQNTTRIADLEELLAGGINSGFNYVSGGEFDTQIDSVGISSDPTNFAKAFDGNVKFRAAGSLKVTKAASNETNENLIISSIQIKDFDKSSILSNEIEYDLSDANYASDMYEFQIWESADNITYAYLSGSRYQIKAGKGTANWTWQSSTNLYYQLRLVCITTSALGIIGYFKNVEIGPQNPSVTGSSAIYLPNYSVTTSWDAGATKTVEAYQIGDLLDITVSMTVTNAATVVATTDFPVITLPNSINTTRYSNISGAIPNSSVKWFDTGSNWYEGGMARVVSATQVKMAPTAGTSNGTSLINATTPITWSAGDQISCHFVVPIQGWSSNMVLSSSTSNREISVIAYKTATQALTADATSVTFANTELRDTANTFDGTTFTTPEDGIYEFKMYGLFSTATAAYYNLYKNGAKIEPSLYFQPASTTTILAPASQRIPLLKGDTITIKTTVTHTPNIATGGASLEIFKENTGSQTIGKEPQVIEIWYDNLGTALSTSEYDFKTITARKSTHAAYNTTTGEFTAPRDGLVDCKISFVSLGSSSFVAGDRVAMYWYVSRSGGAYAAEQVCLDEFQVSVGSMYYRNESAHTTYLNKGDKIKFTVVLTGTTTITLNGNDNFNNQSFIME